MATHFSEQTSAVLLYKKPSTKVGRTASHAVGLYIWTVRDLLLHTTTSMETKTPDHSLDDSDRPVVPLCPLHQPNASTERLDHDSNTLEEEGWHLSREPIVVLAKKNDKTTGPASSQVGG